MKSQLDALVSLLFQTRLETLRDFEAFIKETDPNSDCLELLHSYCMNKNAIKRSKVVKSSPPLKKEKYLL
jgi:hypothetical protein